MDRPEDEFPVERIRGGGAGPSVFAAAVIVIALAAAVIKPWVGGAPAPAESAGPAVVFVPSAAPSPSGSLSPFDGPFGLVCYGGQAWRLVMREVNGSTEVRTWYDLAPTSAAGPDDPIIPVLRVHTEGILSLGYCTNSDTAGLLTVAATTVWRLPALGAPERIGPMRLSADSPTDPNNGSLFIPPRSPDGSAVVDWPAGRYTFEITYEGPFAKPVWFGVDIIAVHPLDEPSDTPSLAPDASPSTAAATGAGPRLAPMPAHVTHALLW